jgi:NAD(P)-dependent dehydrogenase (short-subunit alcohol dehydrogenase family)
MGYTVFAGVRSPEDGRRLRNRCIRDGSKTPCIPIVLDVTSPQSLRECFDFVCGYLGVTTTEDEGKVVRIVKTPGRQKEMMLQGPGMAQQILNNAGAPLSPVRASGSSSSLGGMGGLGTVGENEELPSPPPTKQQLQQQQQQQLTPPLSPTHSANHMYRGHSRLGVVPPITANDLDDSEEDDDLFSLPSRASTPERPTPLHPDEVDPLDLFIGVVNCEGTESPGPLEMLPLAELMRCYEVNTAGAVAITQCFLPLLRESKGRIVNVCSSAGVTAAPINGSYAASKVALAAVSESLRVELYKFGIR